MIARISYLKRFGQNKTILNKLSKVREKSFQYYSAGTETSNLGKSSKIT
jgi:hypothetical protein